MMIHLLILLIYVDNLGIMGFPTEDDFTGSDEEQISIIINNFKDHPSIIDIIENIQINKHFRKMSPSLS